MKRDSKIYVAGHKGLVGSAIVRNLKNKGYENLILRTHDELELINQDEVQAFFENEKPEYVFLAAAKVGGILANNCYRADFIYENLAVQNNVIHQSYLHGVKKLLFLGSSCIYPKNSPQPIKEEYLLTSELEYTNEPYAISKIAGIKMCESYNLQYGTNFISVMPTNLYGENDNFDLEKAHVLPALIRKIHLAKLLNENKIEEVIKDLKVNNFNEAKVILNKFGISKDSVMIWGTGTPMREFLYSDDLASACTFIMEKVDYSQLIKKDMKEIKNTHINIGAGEDISIKNLAYLIKDVVDFKGNFYFDESKPDGTKRKLMDSSKLNNLGWQPTIKLEDGIKKLYESYKCKS